MKNDISKLNANGTITQIVMLNRNPSMGNAVDFLEAYIAARIQTALKTSSKGEVQCKS